MRIATPNPALSIAVVSWGFNFVALKMLYPEMSAPAVSILRFIVMMVLLAGLCRLRGEPLRYHKGDALKVLFAGFVSMGLYMVVYLEGMRGAAPAEGAVVLATAPLFTYFFACLLRQERFSAVALVGSVVAFAGVAGVVLTGSSNAHGTLGGNLLILLSALLWAVAAVMIKPLVGRYSPVQFFTLSLPGALPALLPYGIVSFFHTDFLHLSLMAWTMFAQISVLSGVVAFACFYEGIRQVGAAQATMHQFFVPIFAALFAALLMHQHMAISQWLGMVVVLCGVSIASVARMRDSRSLEVAPVMGSE